MATNYIAPTWRMPENSNQSKFSNYNLEFDSSSQGINLGSDFPYPSVVPDPWSLSFWIKPNEITSTGMIFSTYDMAGLRGIYVNLRNVGTGASNALRFQCLLRGGTTGYSSVVTSNPLIVNEWQHVVVVYDGNYAATLRGFTVYINGSPVSIYRVGSVSANASVITTVDKYIGQREGNSGYLTNCGLAQLAFFDYELSEEQVDYLYNLNNPMAITGKKPTAYYPLGDNSNPRALAGYPNLAVEGSVFDFDSSSVNSQAINLGTNTLSFTQNLTISFWIKTSQTVTNSLTTKDNNQFTGGRCWAVYFNQSLPGKIQFWTTSTGSTSNIKVISSNATVNDNKWHHVVCVNNYTNSTKQIYIDGVLDKTNNDGAAIFNSAAMVQIGNRATNPRFPYDGQMSNLAFWDTAFTLPQVEEAYNNGAPGDISSLNPVAWYKLNAADTFNGSNWTIKDYGSGSNDGTSVDMNSANLVQSNLDSTTPYSKYSVYFDGGTEFMRTPTSYGSYFSGATSCSVSVWVKLDNTAIRNPVLSCWGSSNGNKSYLVRYYNDSRRFQFYLWGPVGAGDSRFGLANAGINISANRWYHIVGTWDGTTIKIYQDGVFAGSESAPGGALQTVNQQNWTGKYLSNSNIMQGHVSNQAFWKNTVLTQGEITEIYNTGVPTDLNNFSGTAPNVWYPMDEKSTYFPGVNHPTDLYIRDVMSDRYSAGLNMNTSNFVGNAPGSSANGTGNNLGINNLKGNMINSTKNSYSINMADYGDPNSQGLTPANSGRTTDVPG